MADGLEIREARSMEDALDAAALIDRIWREGRVVSPELLRALASHGNPVLCAFRGGRMVGAQMGFLAREEGRLLLHSHVTGVAPGAEHRGLGFRLKQAQRDWCLAHDIDTVTWTFDPLIARNAHFNLRKLGAVAVRFLRDFYGRMTDAFNQGERSDRLEVRWDVRSARVASAAEGRPEVGDPSDAAVLLDDEDGSPLRSRSGDGERVLLRIPAEYLELRRHDRALASAWRDAVADVLEERLGLGYQATDFLREGARTGAYLLRRP